MHERSKRSLRLSVPAVSARVSMESVASTLARLIASREAVTRADLVRATGLARLTVTAGLEMLQEAGVICHRRACGRPSAAAAQPRTSG